MGDLYRALSVFWMPSATLSEATDRPVVIVPVVVPTVFAAVTSLVVYFKFPPADALLRGVWTLTLAVAVLGPAFVVLLVSGLFFLIFSFLGRRHSYRSFLSVTALAFVPSAIYHLAQSVVLTRMDHQFENWVVFGYERRFVVSSESESRRGEEIGRFLVREVNTFGATTA